MPLSYHNAQSKLKGPKYEPFWLGLRFRDRAKLYARVDARVDRMMEQGLEAEVRRLLNRGVDPKTTAMQAIGYKEAVLALRGEVSRAEALALVKQASRRYAKRQLTWFRREPDTRWILWEGEPDIEAAAEKIRNSESGIRN